MGKKLAAVVVDTHGIKHYALEGTVDVTTIFGDPAKLAITQHNMNTPFGERVVTTIWMFPYKAGCGKTFPKEGFSGCTILNPIDEFTYEQAVINALTDVGRTYLARSYKDKRYTSFVGRFKSDNDRIDKAIARWARSEGRKLFSDEFGVIGDLDNNPRVKSLTEKLNSDIKRKSITAVHPLTPNTAE